MEHLVAEDIIGQLGLDLTDAFLGEVGLSWLCRPCHQVEAGMFALVMKGGVPAEVRRWHLHRRRDIVAVRSNEISPRRSVVIAEPCGVLPFEGDDVRPHISGIAFQFGHSLVQ